MTGPKWAVSVRSRLPEGYSCTAIEFVRGEETGFSLGRGCCVAEVDVRGGLGKGSKEEPCVLRSSLQ